MQLKLKLWLQTQEIFLFFRRQEERKVVRGRDGRREREGDGREIGWGEVKERERERESMCSMMTSLLTMK